MVEATLEAWRVTGRAGYRDAANVAFDWFLGRNRLGVPVYDAASGGGHDGLTSTGTERQPGSGIHAGLLAGRAGHGAGGAAADSPPALTVAPAASAAPGRWHPTYGGGMASSPGDISTGLFTRYAGNPILSPERWPYTINAVMNAGAAEVDGTTLLLCRVEDRRGLSHLTVARSNDGYSNWVVDPEPLLAPTPGVTAEVWGLEDPRLTWSTELEAWAIAYTSFGPGGPSLSLATTTDFREVTRYGVVRPPEDKNGALLPRQVDGQYILFHRPVTATTHRADVWLSRSADLHSWSPPEPVIAAREGGWWDSARIGIGPPPLETPGRLAADLPRRPPDRGRGALPGRAGAAGPGQPRPGDPALR